MGYMRIRGEKGVFVPWREKERWSTKNIMKDTWRDHDHSYDLMDGTFLTAPPVMGEDPDKCVGVKQKQFVL